MGHSESQKCRVFAAGQVVGEGEGGRGPKEIQIIHEILTQIEKGFLFRCLE